MTNALSPLAFASLLVCHGAFAQVTTPATPSQTTEPLTQLEPVVIKGNYLNAVGTSEAASEGTVTARLLQSRPTLRPAEVLEFVPGVIVSQHSGDGKANQYYLRGFNLDHGTDFATFVDGMPVNMVTHAHGQGYSDLNFLIPELVQSIHYRKGLYAAEDGDFSSAGTARISLANALPRGLASLTAGQNGHGRALVANTTPLKTGQLLYALEATHNNGPWDLPQGAKRFSGLLRYSLSEGGSQHTLTAMSYRSSWKSTDQVPQSAVNSGLIGRFGAIDPTDRGNTHRHSLSWNWLRVLDDGEFNANAYVIASALDLYSNFTYFLDNPVDGDQFEQAEKRRVYGGAVSRLWTGTLAGKETRNTLGLQWRHDRLNPVGLYTSVGGQRSGITQESEVNQSSLGLHAQNDTRWLPWLRSVAGLRADRVDAKVSSNIAPNSGQRHDTITSPKVSLIFGPWQRTEFFVNAGQGFHSNDARGMTAKVTAKSGDPIDAAVPLVRTRGSELGMRTELIPGLQSSIAAWQLKLDSELVFVGDAGETEASGASKRSGIEINNHYVATPWLLLDADLAFSKARFRDIQGDAPNEGQHVPGAVRTVASLGATVTDWGPWFGHFQLRYFGPRPLLEDNSVKSKSTTLAYARVGYKVSPDVKVSLDVFNLFNRKVSDIDYYYESGLKDASGNVNKAFDVHSHPAEPRSVRLTVTANF
jgi:TonB dependent receptor/TonB-dependent Receptor Plug Domain